MGVEFMSDQISEALLELHFHRAIVDMFAEVFGKTFLRMLKPTTNREAWVGFDQGWIHTSVADADLYRELSSAITVGDTQVEAFHLGYFLQFKVVRQLMRRSRFTPVSFVSPYLRSELSVDPSPQTGRSQHETLRRLASIEGADVYYACPLLFDLDKIYDYPDLTSLQVVEVSSAPADIDDTDRHFIAFRNLVDVNAVWCSKPTPARSRTCSEWIRDEAFRPRRRTAKELIGFIENAVRTLSEERQEPRSPIGRERRLPQSFTILSFVT